MHSSPCFSRMWREWWSPEENAWLPGPCQGVLLSLSIYTFLFCCLLHIPTFSPLYFIFFPLPQTFHNSVCGFPFILKGLHLHIYIFLYKHPHRYLHLHLLKVAVANKRWFSTVKTEKGIAKLGCVTSCKVASGLSSRLLTVHSVSLVAQCWLSAPPQRAQSDCAHLHVGWARSPTRFSQLSSPSLQSSATFLSFSCFSFSL